MKFKTGSYYLEKLGGYFFALIIFFLTFNFINPNTILCKGDLFDKTIDVGGLTFGFLLTVLTLMLQTPLKLINAAKRSDKFSELINSNKEAVLVSIVLVGFSLILISLTDFNYNLHHRYIPNLLASTYTGLVFLTANKAYNFLKIFYIIILND